MNLSHRIGCAGLLTDIPLIVAQAKGYFGEANLPVSLSFELGWASIELKLASGQLSVANVPPSLPLLLSLKKGGDSQPMRALAITSYHGEAITLNRETAAVFQSGKLNTLKATRIGIDAPHTLSHVFARSWLKAVRAENHPAIQLIPLALSQLLDLLKDGYIQGFCCAEPLSQTALEAGIGVTVARSRDHPPLQIQSVLAATDEFCLAHPAEAKAITSAVNRARLFCANPKHEAETLRIYRKHLLNRPTGSIQSFGGSNLTPPLSTLIGFEPAPANREKDPFGALAAACATLPGVIAAEREIRDAVKRIYATLP